MGSKYYRFSKLIFISPRSIIPRAMTEMGLFLTNESKIELSIMSPPDIVFLLYYICWRLICPELLIGSIVQQTTSLALPLKGWVPFPNPDSNLICPDDTDDDGDGYTEKDGDCNDANPKINPGATDICGDGIDQDCSDGDCDDDNDTNNIIIDADGDGDNYTKNEGDCNDNDASIHPGATEICGDGIDQDCNGADIPCAPHPPQNLSLIPQAAATLVNLVWSAPNAVVPSGYKVYYGTSSDWFTGWLRNVDVGNHTTCTITGLEEGKFYYFAATAYYPDGTESVFSNVVSKP